MKLPHSTGAIHFIGIGGIGMSGIAEVLLTQGYKVQGSDASENANVQRLRDKGAKIFIGQSANNVENADVVVMSSAIMRDNVELMRARELKIPVVRRAEMLAELMRLKSCIAVAGTHGKTTTTSMVASLLEAGKLDPTVINGGIVNAYGTNARTGEGQWMVVEADESDGTFIKLPADVALVTNIDPEHLDHYGSVEALHKAFKTFVENVPFYGFAVMCIDHPVVQNLVGLVEDRRVITYGENPQADVRVFDIHADAGQMIFSVQLRNRKTGSDVTFEKLALPMPGHHNVLNAVGALAVAYTLGVNEDGIRKGLAAFAGVKRRFTTTGVVNGVTIIDDYGHHPVEIAAVLKAARYVCKGRVIAVVQPHRYTRLKTLFDGFSTCFNDADSVIVADVYSAGEQPIEGASKQDLVEGLIARGHRHVVALESPEALPQLIKDHAQAGDYVICLGAGTITTWANDLPKQLV